MRADVVLGRRDSRVPVFKSRLVLDISRRVKAFLNVEAGLTRGETPELEETPKLESKPRVSKALGASERTGRLRGSRCAGSAPLPRTENSENGAESSESFLLVTYDSCRFDAYQEARTPVLDAHARSGRRRPSPMPRTHRCFRAFCRTCSPKSHSTTATCTSCGASGTAGR